MSRTSDKVGSKSYWRKSRKMTLSNGKVVNAPYGVKARRNFNLFSRA